ncbi:MAG TPA: DUF1844 domain-containing protein [bacterium]|nr:DUF1844 domain-containing protein [bacterium]
MADEKSGKGFTVVDRRVTKEDQPGADEQKGPRPKAEKKAAGPSGTSNEAPAAEDCRTPEQAGQEYKEAAGKADETAAMPPMNFPTFLLSLHASALLHLGVLEDPALGKEAVSPELARQNISLLEILQEKTRGNLSPEESKLLENILYELRMTYLQVTGAVGKKEC